LRVVAVDLFMFPKKRKRERGKGRGWENPPTTATATLPSKPNADTNPPSGKKRRVKKKKGGKKRKWKRKGEGITATSDYLLAVPSSHSHPVESGTARAGKREKKKKRKERGRRRKKVSATVWSSTSKLSVLGFMHKREGKKGKGWGVLPFVNIHIFTLIRGVDGKRREEEGRKEERGEPAGSGKAQEGVGGVQMC